MYKLLLCFRYLRTRYIALASIVSVMLGVATMIVVNSVMAGFTSEMRDRIHGFLADIVVESRSMDGLPDADAQMAIVREAAGDLIAAMTPTVEVPGMIHYTDPATGETFTLPVQLVGIDPGGKAEVGPLKDYLASFQPEMKDGVVLRESERSADQPVTFELTQKAAAYRRMVKQKQLQYLNGNQSDRILNRLKPSNSNGNVAAQTTPPPDFDEPVPFPEFDPMPTPETAVAVAAETPSAAETVPAGDSRSSDLPDFDAPMKRQVADVDPTTPASARVFIGEQITSYRWTDPETGVTHTENMVIPGDDVIITTVRSSTPPEPSHFTATVVDTFRSGMSEYDSSLVLMNLEELQNSRGMIVDGVDAITTIQIRLHNYDDAEEVVKRLQAAFPPGEVSVKTWEAKQGLLLSAVEVETAILNVLLFMIIAVAGFGILAIFFMIVVEKTRDIGILKSLGASSGGIMSIFLSYGVGLGVVGSAAGVAIGILFIRFINEIEDVLSWITGRKVFDPDIYYFNEIPTKMSTLMVIWVAIGAIGIAVLASVLPARRASRLHPVRSLRYE
ncbi:MAG: FtsX-like permease family protein [Planctomycetaceae bacterium]